MLLLLCRFLYAAEPLVLMLLLLAQVLLCCLLQSVCSHLSLRQTQ